MLDYARRNADRLEWRDQDTLNVVLGHRRLALHPRWNAMNAVLNFPQSADVFGAEAVEEARRNPAIRHFEGPAQNKPWHYLQRPRARARPTCATARARRGRDVRMEGRTPRNVLRASAGAAQALTATLPGVVDPVEQQRLGVRRRSTRRPPCARPPSGRSRR